MSTPYEHSDLTGEWKRVEGWPAYWVSDAGQVWSERTARLLKGLMSRDGYKKIHLSTGGVCAQRFVHRLVADAFVDGFGQQVRHLDGDKLNNSCENLRWGTCKENILDKWKHGKMPHGMSHHASKFSVDQVRQIRESSDSSTSLAARFGVSRSAVSAIRRRVSYAWLP
ncbi:HNH endonuclease [Stenotrophomonas indicatrix]|nr:HNH endonuclease [Stenotrophomonas indicatrix]